MRATESHDRPFPALLPFQVLHYPIPQLMKRRSLTSWDGWPRPMDRGVSRWKDRLGLDNAGNQLYIHVPFCPFFCHFCPLYKTTDPRHRNEETRERYVSNVLAEIERYGRMKALQDKRFRTLYFGGGTSTQLTPAQLGRIVDGVRASFRLEDDVEITLEGVATQMLAPGYLEACMEHGFNRVSFGVQTLDPAIRQKVGRGEKVEDYERLIELIRNLGGNLPYNVDLMVGLPGQDTESHDRDLKAVLEWDVGSVDVYSYWMVPGTRLFDNVTMGQRHPPRYGEALLEMRRQTKTRLLGEGFRQISGEAYVRTDPDVFMQTTFGGGGDALNTALGFGPSAIGFLEGTLYQNVANLDRYFQAMEAGCPPVRVAEHVNADSARRRAIMFGLQRLNIPRVLLRDREERLFQEWAGHGLIDLRDDVYWCTPEGSLWYNQMQLALLKLSEQRKLMGLLGAPSQQADALSKRGLPSTHQTEQLMALIRNRGGVTGGLRLLGYKNLVRLKRLPVFDRRAVGFGGPIEQPHRNRSTALRKGASND